VSDESRSPIDHHEGRTPLRRDSQQWLLDYLIQETGKVYHFQGEGRGGLPRGVHSHAMISKHLGRRAQGHERFADAEAAAGHTETALDFYFLAANGWGAAQHPVLDLNEEKRFLYDGLRRCYDRVCELAPYRLERVDVPWNGTMVSGLLHLAPHVDGPAPLVFHVPGCDVTKETWPHPHYNQAHQRGMHVFSFDGPGQGESTLRGIRLTADNYEEAARAVIDVLAERPEVDPERIVVYATSFGSFWGMRMAATDPRIRATVAVQATLADKFILTDLESPRWKQLFAFLTQSETEEELDAVMSGMTMRGYMERISSPTLLTVGEYDPRTPLRELYPLFDRMTAPAVLWVMADQHHSFTVGPGATWARGSHGVLMDWLRDRLTGRPLEHAGEVLYVEGGAGPNGPDVQAKRWWFE
jgi:pimeloyl-ACP methyl ester carboxylesterase